MEAFVRPTAASLIKIMVALRNNTLLVVENRIRSKASHSDDESRNLLAAIAASLRQLLLRLLSHSITGVLLRVHLVILTIFVAQTKQKKEPANPSLAALSKLGAADTAFPDLKLPKLPDETRKEDVRRYAEELAAIIFKDLLPELT